MLLAQSGSSAYHPGIWALVALAAILILTVVVAKRERDRRDKITAALPADSWSAPCLDGAAPNAKRLLVVGTDGIAITELRSGSTDSWPWAEVAGVAARAVRIRMQSNPGLRITLTNGHVRDVLVYTGAGKAGYEAGAREAQAQIERRLPRKPAQ